MTHTATAAVHKYSVAARVFHWVGALLILAAWLIIEQGDDFISLHKSVGFSFLIWTVLRILNRLISKTPPAAMPKLHSIASAVVHFLLYVVMLAMPLTAFMASMYGGYGVNVFGLFQIPGFGSVNDSLAGTLMDWHTGLIWPLLLALIAAHIIGALYHQFILKDNLLARMR